MNIKGRALILFLTVLLLVGSVPFVVSAASVEENAMTTEAKIIYDAFRGNLVKSELKKDDGYINTPVHLYIYTDGKEAGQTRDVIFYVINHANERIGQESDVSIVGDYINQGFVVVVVDYLNDSRTVSPNIEHSLAKLREYYMVNKTGFSGTKISVRKNYAYFLPAGYRLERGVVFWEQDIHASYGTIDYIIKAWNDVIVGKKKVNGELAKTAETIDDCTKPDGSPLELRLCMDIIYPSNPKEETPVYAMASTQAEMHMHTCESTCCQFVGFTFNGYTAITFDYVYIPMAREDHFGYFSPYGTHRYNAAKVARAAIRCIRYYAEKFGYNDDLIGVVGISKGSPAPSVLSVIGNEDVPEYLRFECDPNGDRFEGDVLDANGNVIETAQQPFLTYEGGYDGNTAYYGTDSDKKGEISSEITVAYCAAGDGANWMYKSASQYDRVPLVLSCGKLDQYNCWEHWPGIVQHFEKNANSPYLAMGMEEQAHVYPMGYDTVLGYDRYPQMLKFFDYYLKPERYTPSVVWMTPLDGGDNLSLYTGFEVKFISPMKPETLADGLVITDSNGNRVEGQWVASELNTRFKLSSGALKAGNKYTVTITDALKDENGTPYTDPFTRTFVTEGSREFTPIADTYVSAKEPDSVFGKSQTLVIGGKGSKENLALVSFESDGLSDAGAVCIRMPSFSRDGKTVGIYVIDGYTVNEETLCYSNLPPVGNVYLGEYTLSSEGVLLDAGMLSSVVSKSTFTLVFRSSDSVSGSLASREKDDAWKMTLIAGEKDEFNSPQTSVFEQVEYAPLPETPLPETEPEIEPEAGVDTQPGEGDDIQEPRSSSKIGTAAAIAAGVAVGVAATVVVTKKKKKK